MELFERLESAGVDLVTLAIHLYAFAVLLLTMFVFSLHRHRLHDLGRRVATIAKHIEGQPGRGAAAVDLNHLTGLILHLGEVVQRRKDLDLLPVMEFLRSEERDRQRGVGSTLVNITETMIELFPVLGILGTVWGISGIAKQEFSSDRLLYLFGIAVGTTLWALLYVVFFRIAYSAFIQEKVVTLAEHVTRYREFLSLLEYRAAGSLAVAGPAKEKAGSTL